MKRKVLEGKASLSGVRRVIRADLTDAGVRPAQAFDCLVAITEACIAPRGTTVTLVERFER